MEEFLGHSYADEEKGPLMNVSDYKQSEIDNHVSMERRRNIGTEIDSQIKLQSSISGKSVLENYAELLKDRKQESTIDSSSHSKQRPEENSKLSLQNAVPQPTVAQVFKEEVIRDSREADPNLVRVLKEPAKTYEESKLMEEEPKKIYQEVVIPPSTPDEVLHEPAEGETRTTRLTEVSLDLRCSHYLRKQGACKGRS